MTTRDGYHWEVEMASRQNRHHPFVAVAYCYCVKDAEGKVLRRESLASARQYVFDESKNFYFQDYWLEEDNPYVEKNAFVLAEVLTAMTCYQNQLLTISQTINIITCLL